MQASTSPHNWELERQATEVTTKSTWKKKWDFSVFTFDACERSWNFQPLYTERSLRAHTMRHSRCGYVLAFCVPFRCVRVFVWWNICEKSDWALSTNKKIAMRMHGTTETLLSFGPPVADKNDFPIFLFCFPFPPSITVRQSHLHINLCARIAIKIERKKNEKKRKCITSRPHQNPICKLIHPQRELARAHNAHNVDDEQSTLSYCQKMQITHIYMPRSFFPLSFYFFFLVLCTFLKSNLNVINFHQRCHQHITLSFHNSLRCCRSFFFFSHVGCMQILNTPVLMFISC